MLTSVCQTLDISAPVNERLQVTGQEALPSYYPVTDLAVASIGAACLALSELIGCAGEPPAMVVDRRLSSLWFGWSIRPLGWTMPTPWDPIAGDYHSKDGWIRLHTNAPHHRAAALSVLHCEATRETVAKAVSGWTAMELESAIASAKGCAAAMRTHEAWKLHEQGRAVNAEPLVATERKQAAQQFPWHPKRDRPLAGIRVLDLTRVLAGPVGTRFLAGFGADVLRVDPPGWDEPGVIPDVTLGKNCIRLDLHEPGDRAIFERLLADADVLVHGYRAGALEGLGYGSATLQSIRAGLIEVSLNAYGHSGPWCLRRGFDSLVQMSCGIAAAGMGWKQAERPFPLPVQALDHATGYLMAAAVIRGLSARLNGSTTMRARLSLARTAKLLMDHRSDPTSEDPSRSADADLCDEIEPTPWGPAQRIRPPALVEGAEMRWDRPAAELGSGTAKWGRKPQERDMTFYPNRTQSMASSTIGREQEIPDLDDSARRPVDQDKVRGHDHRAGAVEDQHGRPSFDCAQREPPFRFFGIAREIGSNLVASLPLEPVHQFERHVVGEHGADCVEIAASPLWNRWT
jgi:hypothetical protein